ncbi:hypothetical protein F4801DRAFT_595502 [Xylaria longipes]|nr:hypothetical protein F4801DRAFT_595502 [Xylaria longipes]
MLCGHVETYFSSPCGRKCSSPQGVTKQLDKPCTRCDPENRKEKRKARTAELMSQLRHGENEDEVQSLTERANQLNLNMQRNIAETRRMMYGAANASSTPSSPNTGNQSFTAGRSWGVRPASRSGIRSGKAPWDSGSDSESDKGRRDTSYLTGDGKHVVQKEYKLINGHFALIAYRKELSEVDPHLLRKLREKREKELAKLEARQRKREGKRRARNGECNNDIGKTKSDSKTHHETIMNEEKKAMEKWRSVCRSSEPNSPRHSPKGKSSRATTAGEQQAEKKSRRESKVSIHEERHGTRKPPQTEARKTHKHKSPTSRYRSNSFRARAEQDGFRPTSQWGFGDDGYEQEPAQAESSRGSAERQGLRRVERRTWVERFAEDITYDSNSSSDSDSVVTVLRVPVHQPGTKSGKSTGDGKSRRQNRMVEDEECLDVWHKIADEE